MNSESTSHGELSCHTTKPSHSSESCSKSPDCDTESGTVEKAQKTCSLKEILHSTSLPSRSVSGHVRHFQRSWLDQHRGIGRSFEVGRPWVCQWVETTLIRLNEGRVSV